MGDGRVFSSEWVIPFSGYLNSSGIALPAPPLCASMQPLHLRLGVKVELNIPVCHLRRVGCYHIANRKAT